MMRPAYWVGFDGKRLPYREYTVDTDPKYMHGRKTLPKEGWPYSMEFEYNFGPKLSHGDGPVDLIHNLMCFYYYEDIDLINELKKRAKTGVETYPDHFMYKLTLASINLVTQEIASWCNEFKLGMFEYPITKEKLVDIAIMMAMRDYTGIGADVVTKTIEAMMNDPLLSFSDAYERSLPIVVSNDDLERMVREVFNAFPKKIEEYKSGKKGVASMFIGEVMRKKKGLDPKEVVKAIEKGLNEL